MCVHRLSGLLWFGLVFIVLRKSCLTKAHQVSAKEDCIHLDQTQI